MQAKIEINSDGAATQVWLNGMDISMQVSRIEYTHKSGSFPEVSLTFPAAELSVASVSTVKFPDAIFTALTKKQREELLADNPSLLDDLKFHTDASSLHE